jgi:hypothetical protein
LGFGFGPRLTGTDLATSAIGIDSGAIMNQDTQDALAHAALGAAAGVVGTFVLQGLMAAHKRWMPESLPPIKADPGQFMIHQAERALPAGVMQSIPESAESVASKTMQLGYGASFGAAYGAVRGQGGSALTDGAALGLATWATGYLGWLPATGLMPPPWEHKPAQLALPIVEHALYGIATVAAYELMHHFVHPQEQRH